MVSVALIWLLLTRVDTFRLWQAVRTASVGWLAAALGIYAIMILISAWRWGLLLRAHGLCLPFRTLTGSFLVATFFNNFLPSNIGGDVVRVTDTAPAVGSKTQAATVVLIDRALGLVGLVLVAAVGASVLPAGITGATTPGGPAMLWAAAALAAVLITQALLVPKRFVRLLTPLHALRSSWIDERLERLTGSLSRFGKAPGAVFACLAGAIMVQGVLVGFYVAVAQGLHVPVGFAELAVIVPVSFVIQMVPVSMNGFGVREATFGFYFTQLGLPLESALLVSFVGAALIMLFSLSGAVTYLSREKSRRSA